MVCLLCQGRFKLTSAKTNIRSEWMTQRQQHGCIHRLLSHDPHRFVQSRASFDQQMLYIYNTEGTSSNNPGRVV